MQVERLNVMVLITACRIWSCVVLLHGILQLVNIDIQVPHTWVS